MPEGRKAANTKKNNKLLQTLRETKFVTKKFVSGLFWCASICSVERFLQRGTYKINDKGLWAFSKYVHVCFDKETNKERKEGKTKTEKSKRGILTQ